MVVSIVSIIMIVGFIIMGIGMIGTLICMVFDNFVIGDIFCYMIGVGFAIFMLFLLIVIVLNAIGC